MGLDQYLETDHYFSPTWDQTGEIAQRITDLCGVPRSLVTQPQVSVQIILMQWRNLHWLHTFLQEACDASPDADSFLVDEYALRKFVDMADEVLCNDCSIERAFPLPTWLLQFRHSRKQSLEHDPDDLEILRLTRDRFLQILDELPNCDLRYRSSV